MYYSVCVELDFREVFFQAFSCFAEIVEMTIFSAKLLDIVIVWPPIHCIPTIHCEVFFFILVACHLESVRYRRERERESSHKAA